MNLYTEIGQILDKGECVALVTVVRSEGSSPQKGGTRMAVRPDGSILGTIGGGAVELEVISRAQQVLKSGRAERFQVHLTRDLGMCCGGAMEFYIEPLQQDPTLVVFGGGHVGGALCKLASFVGFRVIVVDEREEFASPERHPDAFRVVDADPVDALEQLPFGPTSYLVIVTHSHRQDEELLRKLVDREFKYLGMIGSRAKIARFMDRLKTRGINEQALSRVHMPIGLSIGAQSPEEIAVSIVGEMIGARRLPTPAEYDGPTMYWRPTGGTD